MMQFKPAKNGTYPNFFFKIMHRKIIHIFFYHYSLLTKHQIDVRLARYWPRSLMYIYKKSI